MLLLFRVTPIRYGTTTPRFNGSTAALFWTNDDRLLWSKDIIEKKKPNTIRREHAAAAMHRQGGARGAWKKSPNTLSPLPVPRRRRVDIISLRAHGPYPNCYLKHRCVYRAEFLRPFVFAPFSIVTGLLHAVRPDTM